MQFSTLWPISHTHTPQDMLAPLDVTALAGSAVAMQQALEAADVLMEVADFALMCFDKAMQNNSRYGAGSALRGDG